MEFIRDLLYVFLSQGFTVVDAEEHAPAMTHFNLLFTLEVVFGILYSLVLVAENQFYCVSRPVPLAYFHKLSLPLLKLFLIKLLYLLL